MPRHFYGGPNPFALARFATRVLPALLALALLFSACGEDDSGTALQSLSSSSSAAQSAASSQGTSSASLTPEGTAVESMLTSPQDASSPSTVPANSVSAGSVLSGTSVSSTASAPASPASLPLGTFAHLSTDGTYPDERAPVLELLDGNKGVFTLNTGSGMGSVAGPVSYQGGTVTLSIETLELEAEGSFWGQDLSSLSFAVLDENQLQYTGSPFGLTQGGFIFQRQSSSPGALEQGVGATPAPQPAPASTPSQVSSLSPSSSSAPQSNVSSSVSSSLPANSSSSAANTGVSQPELSNIPVAQEGIPLWLLIAVGAGALGLGVAGAIFIPGFLRRRKENAEEEALPPSDDDGNEEREPLHNSLQDNEPMDDDEPTESKAELAARLKEAKKAEKDAKKAEVQAKQAAQKKLAAAKKRQAKAKKQQQKASKIAQDKENRARKAAAKASKAAKEADRAAAKAKAASAAAHKKDASSKNTEEDVPDSDE